MGVPRVSGDKPNMFCTGFEGELGSPRQRG